MANHLITNALLRPHGTNNPYNTLLGESAVYNNPSVSMYNAQGVLEFLSNFSSENSIFCGLFWPIPFFFFFFFSSFYFFSPHAHTLFFLEPGTKKRFSPLPFISMHLSIFQMLFFHEQSSSLWKTFVSFTQSIHSILILIFFFFSLLAFVLFWTCVCVCVCVCSVRHIHSSLCCQCISLLNHSFQKQEHRWR